MPPPQHRRPTKRRRRRRRRPTLGLISFSAAFGVFGIYNLLVSHRRVSSTLPHDITTTTTSLARKQKRAYVGHLKPQLIPHDDENNNEKPSRQRTQVTSTTIIFPEKEIVESSTAIDLEAVEEKDEGGYDDDGDSEEAEVPENQSALDMITDRTGGLYPRDRLEHHPSTCSFANCTYSPPRDSAIEASHVSSLLVESGVLTVSCRTFRYRLQKETFQNRTSTGSIITGVLSSATAKGRRKAIRETWASGDDKPVFFLLAGPWENIQKEFDRYGDIIWIDQEEAYFRITEKTASFFYLVDKVATALELDYSHVLKVDDDSYVALDRLQARFDFIVQQQSWKQPPSRSTSWMWGSCRPRQVQPIRDEKNIWKMSHSEYPERRYPYYCQGGGYALSWELVHCAAAMGHIANIRYLRMEDVYAGMLAERCRVEALFDEPDFVRIYRSGKAGSGAVWEEIRRNRYGLGKINANDEWVADADMASRIVQHNVFSPQDMRDYHASYLRHSLHAPSSVRTGDRVLYFDDDRGNGWEEATVLSTQHPSGAIETMVQLRFETDGYITSRVFDDAYSGRWSKPLELDIMSYYTNLDGDDNEKLVATSSEKLNTTIRDLKRVFWRYYVYEDPDIDQSEVLAVLRSQNYTSSRVEKFDHIRLDLDAETNILQSLKVHPLRTKDPEKADYFVVPTPVTEMMLRGCVTEGCAWFDNAFEALRRQSCFTKWNGNRHVLIALHWTQFNDRYAAYVPALSRNYKKLQNVTVAHNYDPFGALRLMQQSPVIDATAPGFEHLYKLELPVTRAFSLGLGYGNSFPIRSPSFDNFHKSKYFLFYHSRDTAQKPYSFGSTKFRDTPLNATVKAFLPPSSIGHDMEKSSWLTDLFSSQFCLVIRGDTPHSHSLLHAVRAGCVPVVVSDDYETYAGPLKSSLSMADFCIFISEDDFLHDPLKELQHLLTLGEKNIITILQNLKNAQRVIFPDHPESVFVPAFLMELQETQKRAVAEAQEAGSSLDWIDSSVIVGGNFVPYRYSPGMVAKPPSKRDSGRPRIVAVVLSMSKHFHRRQAIRNTWARDQRVIFFVIGGEWEDMSSEFSEEKDIIWIKSTNTTVKEIEGALVAFHFVTSLLTDYDYIMKTNDDTFAYLPDAESLLQSHPQDYWSSCTVDVDWHRQGKPYTARILDIHGTNDRTTLKSETASTDANGVVIEVVYDDNEHEFAAIDQINPRGLGYFISRRFAQCLVGRLANMTSLSHFAVSKPAMPAHDELVVRASAHTCGVQCVSKGWEWYGKDSTKDKEFMSVGIETSSQMVFHYWDALKARRVGEFAVEDD